MDPDSEISRYVWDTKYRWREGTAAREASLEETWQRVASALAEAEPAAQRTAWQRRFYSALENFRFLPGGRILAGAGTNRRVTLFNCFVMGTIGDSLDGIFGALKEGAATMLEGGGIGSDFSTLRPHGTGLTEVGALAPGPVASMQMWDSMCATVLSAGGRRGAMMGTLRCDHPDIERFIAAKQDGQSLRRFNLSILITDAFMQALAGDTDWPLVFPLAAGERHGESSDETVLREWPGHATDWPCRIVRRVSARALWQDIMRSNYDYAEPGVIFIDRLRQTDTLGYGERIAATNPCGEIPLPPYGACDLGSINLTRFVTAPFTPQAAFDLEAIEDIAAVAARMLDNVYEIAHFPLPQQRVAALHSRRVGLGITGLADALVMLGLEYGSPASLVCAGEVMRRVCHAAYRTSIGLARERGSFPAFDAEQHVRGTFVAALPPDIVTDIARYGLRNSHLTAIAPAGTISLLAGNVSSGVEPIFAERFTRDLPDVPGTDDEPRHIEIEDYAAALYRRLHPDRPGLPPGWRDATQIDPFTQLAMQAVLQPHVDNAISKTVSIPADYPFERFQAIYEEAYRLGLKGCTAYRIGSARGAVLRADGESDAACCGALAG